MSVLKILIIPNFTKEDAVAKTNQVCCMLYSAGCELYMHSYKAENILPGLINCEPDLNALLEKCHIVIALGGDGTIIHSAKLASAHKKPVLGINLGRLGYTAAIEFSEIDLLKNLLNGEFEIERRMMLCARATQGGEERSFYAVNDMVVHGELARILDFSVRPEGGIPLHYRADGMIAATPTGSTAYALAAGGPVIDPSLQSILITPICAHSLFARPIIFNEKSLIEISANGIMHLTADGEDSLTLEAGHSVIIEKSSADALFIRIKNRYFADILTEKFKERT
ncbi:MAG: NAD(+)/NADH kinase [Oscillospiraceae bacterium]|nr:NAD(+)/NADH kinase [Oscillospiraceae bacterium]